MHNKKAINHAPESQHRNYSSFDIELFLRIAKEEKIYHPHSLISMLQTYKYGEKGEGLEIDDRDALDFYNLIIKESKFNEYVTISNKYHFKNLRLGNMSVLHLYLQAKKLISDNSEFLRPPSDRDTRVHRKRIR